MGALGLALLAQLVLVRWPPSAAGQSVTGGARVTTYVDACVPVDIEQFHRLLAIELGTSIEYSPGAAQAPDGALIRVTCGDAGVELQLQDNLTHKAMQRLVDLPQVAVSARTRLLALAVAEFVVASWVELHLRQPAELAPLVPAVPPMAAQAVQQVLQARISPEPLATQAAAAHWLLGLSFDPIVFTRGSDIVPQLAFRLEQRPIRQLAIGLALSIGHGEWAVRWPDIVVGVAQLTTTSGRFGLAYVREAGAVDLLVGAGVRIGVVHMAGETQLRRLLAVAKYYPWGGPALTFGTALHAGDHVRVLLELETGCVTLPAQATIRESGTTNGESVIAEFGGFWASLGLGIGWSF